VPAGRLAATGDRVTVLEVGDPAIQYAQHTEAGSRLEVPGHARWTIQWTAPAHYNGRAVFHIVANAANDDDSEFGDHIYADSLILYGNSNWGIRESRTNSNWGIRESRTN
jgi:choline dehydrogenase-like flavoprotein